MWSPHLQWFLPTHCYYSIFSSFSLHFPRRDNKSHTQHFHFYTTTQITDIIIFQNVIPGHCLKIHQLPWREKPSSMPPLLFIFSSLCLCSRNPSLPPLAVNLLTLFAAAVVLISALTPSVEKINKQGSKQPLKEGVLVTL